MTCSILPKSEERVTPHCICSWLRTNYIWVVQARSLPSLTPLCFALAAIKSVIGNCSRATGARRPFKSRTQA
jgi:hypothetical protein